MFRFTRHARLAALLVGVCAMFLLAGCKKPVGTVTGKVTYQGKQLKAASISFISTDGSRSYAAGIRDDGTYYIPDLEGGTYKVCVDTEFLKPPITAMGPGMKQPATKDKDKFGPPPGANVPEGYTPSSPAAAQQAASAKKYVAIPPKYADKDQTDLTYTFSGGNQTYDIELK
jgi:hypothetical protein